MPKINFRSSSLEPVPKAHYLVDVQSMEMKAAGPQAKHPGSPYLETWFGILNDKEHAGRRLPHNFSLLPQSGWVLKDFLEKLGVPHDAIPGPGKGEFEISFNTEDCIGKHTVADVTIVTGKDKSGNAQLRNEIDGFLKA